MQVQPKDLNNGVINACFLLLFKDLIKLYACYNDGIINLLGESILLASVNRSPQNKSHFTRSALQKNSSRWREASVKTGWRSTRDSWREWRGFQISLRSQRWTPDLISLHSSCYRLCWWILTAFFPFTANGDRQKWHSRTHSGKNHSQVPIGPELRNDCFGLAT